MTPETDPRQKVESVVTPGKGVRRLPGELAEPAGIDLARHRRDHALTQRHPARLGLPPVPRGVVERTLPDAEIEGVARAIGMTDHGPRHRVGGPIRKRDAARDAILRMLPGGRA
jgi:hypothetical protein